MFGWFQKAAPQRTADEAPRTPRAVFYKNSQAVVVYDNICKVQAALQHPTIQRCLRMICRAVQVVDWYVEADDSGDRASNRIIRDLNDLLKSPNDDMTPAQLRYWLAFSLGTYSRAAFKVGKGVGSAPNGIYPLDAKYLKTKVDDRGKIRRYIYGTSGNEQEFPSQRYAGDGAFAYQIRPPSLSADPSSDLDILNPLNGIGGPARVIDALLQRTLATAQGHPNAKYIVSSEDDLTEEQLDELDEYIESHEAFGERSGEIMFLRGAKVQVHRLDADLSDIHSKVPMDDMTRMIFGMYGIPIALAGLGAADAAKFTSNLAESRSMFYNDTIVPEYLSPIAEGMTRAICPPGARVRFDLDSLPALLPSRIEAASQLDKVSFLSNEEKRKMIGFEGPGPSNSKEKPDA